MMSLNLTIGEYFEYNNMEEMREYLQYLFWVQDNTNKSEWNRSDKITGVQPHLESQIKKQYTEHKRNYNVVPIVEYVFDANTFLNIKRN
jgi:acetyl-CoA carboxylase carboxyltransferase component